MMRLHRLVNLVLGVLALAPLQLAYANWTGTGEAGALLSRGNSEATSGNLKLDLAREFEPWKASTFAAVLYSENAAFTTADRMEVRGQLDYQLNERSFVFTALRAEQDRFSGFAYQASLSGGVGYKFIDTEETKLSGTLGAGYRRLRPETLIKSAAGEVLQRIPGDAESDPVANAGLSYEQQVTKTTKLVDKFLVEAGSSNTSAQNDFAVQVSMTEVLALSVGYGVRYNTDPPPGSEETDHLTTLNLVYTFK